MSLVLHFEWPEILGHLRDAPERDPACLRRLVTRRFSKQESSSRGLTTDLQADMLQIDIILKLFLMRDRHRRQNHASERRLHAAEGCSQEDVRVGRSLQELVDISLALGHESLVVGMAVPPPLEAGSGVARHVSRSRMSTVGH